VAHWEGYSHRIACGLFSGGSGKCLSRRRSGILGICLSANWRAGVHYCTQFRWASWAGEPADSRPRSWQRIIGIQRGSRWEQGSSGDKATYRTVGNVSDDWVSRLGRVSRIFHTWHNQRFPLARLIRVPKWRRGGRTVNKLPTVLPRRAAQFCR
jgi:hypothetical protein